MKSQNLTRIVCSLVAATTVCIALGALTTSSTEARPQLVRRIVGRSVEAVQNVRANRPRIFIPASSSGCTGLYRPSRAICGPVQAKPKATGDLGTLQVPPQSPQSGSANGSTNTDPNTLTLDPDGVLRGNVNLGAGLDRGSNLEARRNDRAPLLKALSILSLGRDSAAEREAIRALENNPEAQAKFRAGVKDIAGFDPQTFAEWLEVFLKYAPQIIALILTLI